MIPQHTKDKHITIDIYCIVIEHELVANLPLVMKILVSILNCKFQLFYAFNAWHPHGQKASLKSLQSKLHVSQPYQPLNYALQSFVDMERSNSLLTFIWYLTHEISIFLSCLMEVISKWLIPSTNMVNYDQS